MNKIKKAMLALMAATVILTGSSSVTSAASAPATAKSLTITEGSKKTITVKGANIKSKTFKSSNTKVAKVDKKGVVTAKKKGNCQITVTVKYLKKKNAKNTSKKTLKTKVTVNEKIAAPTATKSLTITEGSKKTIKVTGTTVKSMTFKSRNTRVAEVDAKGAVTGKKRGSCDIKTTVKYLKTKNAKNTSTVILTTTVTVNKIDPMLAGDRGALAKIINEQKALGVTLPADFSDPKYNFDYNESEINSNERIYGWSKNGELKYIDWSNMGLKGSVSLSAFKNLEYAYISYGGLTDLDIKGCVDLKELSCDNNLLENLDTTNNTSLSYLSCSENKFKELDITNNTSLSYFNCDKNQLENLNVSNYPELCQLSCSSNQLTSLNVSDCPQLYILSCAKNQLTDLGIRNCQLGRLHCEENQLTNLDISDCPTLEELVCDKNRLTELNVNICPQLSMLSCPENELKNLNVDACPKLKYLYCYKNPLADLDVNACPVLEFLSCDQSVNLTGVPSICNVTYINN